MRTTAQNAELALLLEVAGTPKPGNVDRERDLSDLRFEHFLAGAVGAQEGLRGAADPEERLGTAFERSVAGMADQNGGNTQFGALLLLMPLVRAAATGELIPERASDAAEETTVEDAVDFFRALDHVDVAVRDPPENLAELDVTRGSDAVSDIRDRGDSLYEVMELSADRDGIAREWVGGFERTFRAGEMIADGEGPVSHRAANGYLRLLSREPDPFVETNHGRGVAKSVMVRAQAAREGGPDLVQAFADSLVEEGINPGTTADIVVGGLFVALERHGVSV